MDSRYVSPVKDLSEEEMVLIDLMMKDRYQANRSCVTDGFKKTGPGLYVCAYSRQPQNTKEAPTLYMVHVSCDYRSETQPAAVIVYKHFESYDLGFKEHLRLREKKGGD